MRSVLAVTVWLCLIVPALAQHNHERGHSDYQNWSSGKVANCCNNQDCGGLSEADMRATGAGLEVLIAGEWCPVLREHFLTRGRSPDWNTAHVCIGKSAHHLTMPPCERLLCFTGKGGF